MVELNEIGLANVAYVAGLFDGEGYICFSYKKGGHGVAQRDKTLTTFYITVTNNYQPVLHYLQCLFGGSIVFAQSGGRAYFWKLTRKPAFGVLRLILPYLKVKRELASLILKHQALIQAMGPRTAQEKERLKKLYEKVRPYTMRESRAKPIGKLVPVEPL